MEHEHGHEHGAVEVPEAMAVPKVSIEVLPDPKSGWNLHIMTQDFLFAPERASMEHSPGEGHAHLYVDGEKIGRLYGPWYHISELSPGQHEIRVTLNANDHRDYTVNGEVISASAKLTVE